VKQKARVAADLPEEKTANSLTPSLLLGLILSHGELGSHHHLEINRGHFLKIRLVITENRDAVICEL